MDAHVYVGTLLVKAVWVFADTRKNVDEVIVHVFSLFSKATNQNTIDMTARLISLLMMLFIGMRANAQVYTCEQLQSDIKAWNEIKNSNNTKWANAIKEKGLYKTNTDGSFEYVYILNTTDSVDIPTLRKISFDFLSYVFNISNATRADMETNSPEDGVIYKGKVAGVGEFVGFGEYNKINANVHFDIRFKPNRIRFSVKVQEYQVIKTSGAAILQNNIVYVKDCYPMNQNSDHKKSYAMAFINSNSNCLNFSKRFLDYLNKHIKEKQPTVVEDW